MNGRVYDPALGRFLSVDPIIQAPTNMQSLNPYSYVLNNPLSLTDPSGYAPQCPTDTTCNENGSGKELYDGKNAGNDNGNSTGSHAGFDTGVKGGDLANLQTQHAIAKFLASNGETNQSQGAASTLATSQGQGAGAGLGTSTVAATQNASSGLVGKIFSAIMNWISSASAANNPNTNPTPQELEEKLEEIAAKYNIPVEAAKALVATESRGKQFDKNGGTIVNTGKDHKNHATGLMQIEPATANQYHTSMEDIRSSWVINLDVGLHYYSDLYHHVVSAEVTDLRTRAALAYDAYHAGPTGFAEKLGNPTSLTGKSYEDLYLSHYDH